MRPPVVLERSGRPGLDGRTSRFRTRIISLGPKVLECPFLGYNAVQGGFEGTSVSKEASKDESDVLNKRCKVPTASSAPAVM